MAKENKKILFVDDEPAVSTIVKSRLESKGYKVTALTSTKEALTLLNKESFDLIIMDHLMPEMKGTDLCRMIKQDPKVGGIPIVIFTAHMNQDFEKECNEAGAIGIVYKPSVAELVNSIGKMFRGERVFWEDDGSDLELADEEF